MTPEQLETFDTIVDDLVELRNVIRSARKYLESGQLSVNSVTIPAYLNFSVGVLRYVELHEEERIHDLYVYNRDELNLEDSTLIGLMKLQGISLP